MKRNFTISFQAKALATVLATDPATALKQYAKDHNLGTVITPLRKENPTRVFTHNGQSDYIADRWSGEIAGTGRFYLLA